MTKYYFNERLMHHMALMQQNYTIDRTGTYPCHEDMQILSPVGELVVPRPIEELMHERAQEIVAFAREKNKKIYLFWSGGIDSTAVFFALTDYVTPEELVVVCNSTSEDEYPGFIAQHIRGIYEMYTIDMQATWQAVNHACTNGIAVTGEIGDQLFGSVKFLDYTSFELKQNWKNIVSQYNTTYVEQLEPYVDACPQKIESLASLYWWINYGMKYQLVQVRMMRDNKESILGVNLLHFFDTKQFNDWTISTPIEDKIPDFDQMKYKMPLREFIYKQNGDKEYFAGKGKVRSLAPKYGRASKSLLASGITTNFEREYN